MWFSRLKSIRYHFALWFLNNSDVHADFNNFYISEIYYCGVVLIIFISVRSITVVLFFRLCP